MKIKLNISILNTVNGVYEIRNRNISIMWSIFMSKEKISIKLSTSREVQLGKKQILAYISRPVIRDRKRPK